MREIDFLPAWYPQVRRRRKRVVWQAYFAVAVVGVMVGWQVVANQEVRRSERTLVDLRGKLDVAAVEIQKEAQLEALKTEINRKLAINSKVGSPVATTRLLRTIEQCMPESMTLTSFKAELEERRGGTSKLAAARAAQKDETVERRLRVTVVGVAPTDAELAEFLRKLSDITVFEQVTMTYAKPREDEKYVMRESEVTFSMDLTGPGIPAIPSATPATPPGAPAGPTASVSASGG